MSQELPVYVAVTRDDGRAEQVRIGTAVQKGDGFVLSFEGLSIGGSPVAPRAAPKRAAASGAPSGSAPSASDGMLLPNYGRSKGQPVSGASLQDLEFYANGARRTLSDPGKARWHDKERQLLAAIEAEIAKQRGEEPPAGDDVPPPTDDDAPF